MHMNSRSRIVTLITKILNVRYWFDWDRVKAATSYIVQGVKNMFIPKKSSETQSFEDAKTNLEINDESLLQKQQALLRLSYLMVIIACAIFIYAFYQLFWGSFKATLISLVVTLIALSLAFRYNFWHYQIKSRKLGCSFNEWVKKGLLGEKDE